MIARNYEPKRIERQSDKSAADALRGGARTILRGVEGTAKFLAKQGVKEGAKILPDVGELTGAGLAVIADNPELAPGFAWVGKQGGKYLEKKAGEFVDSI